MPISKHTGHGPTVFVLIHSSPGDARQWAAVASALEQRGEVVLIDLPDHGSAPDTESLDPDDSLADVRAIVAALAPRPIVLGGVSYGAYLAARLLAEPPEYVRGAVLLSGYAGLTEAHAASYLELAQNLGSGAMPIPAFARFASELLIGNSASALEQRSFVEQSLRELTRERLVRSLQRGGRCAQPDRRVLRFAVPATLLHGRHDQALPLSYADELTGLGPTRLETLDTSSHLLSMTHPEQCLNALLAYA